MKRHKMKCNKCNHTWETESLRLYLTCPSCQSKVLNDVKGGKKDGRRK